MSMMSISCHADDVSLRRK